jgi:serine/threonine-protein kinase
LPAPRTVNEARAVGKARVNSFIGSIVGDKYAIRALVGEGGMGAVYVAEHMTIGGEVAIKVLHPALMHSPEAASRLRHEARVAGTLGHPNICTIYDMGRLADGRPYIVMERLRGETLAERIERAGRVGYLDVVDIASQVLSALAAAHERGVVHRDLKPENIFLSHRVGMAPVPKLLDFGVSKAESVEDTCAETTGSGPAAGTPYYMAPEVARGERGLDHRVDIWAVAVVMYQALTGVRPFQGNNYNAVLVDIIRTQPTHIETLVRGIPAGLVAAVNRGLAKQPADRFGSALEFQSALRPFRHKERPSGQMTIAPMVSLEEADDATTVFVRSALPMPDDPGEVDNEMTVVDPPSFGESLTAIRAEYRKKP